MKNLITFFGERPIFSHHAGSKARIDVDDILLQRYSSPLVNLSLNSINSRLSKILYLLNPGNLKSIYNILKIRGKTIVFQYPYYNKIYKKIVSRILPENTSILIIHDIDFLRGISEQDTKKIIQDLNNCKIIIVHNSNMISKLSEFGIKSMMIDLEVFDYLLNIRPNVSRYLSKEIAFAGNLKKSEFLENERIGELGITFNLYGPNFEKENIRWTNAHFKGSYPPNEIPYKIQGSFGLIWDGPSINTCDGPNGKYMQYNNPHKLSLYIAAGLPVVVWKEAAIAKFVEKYKIGFCVDSLEEILGVIDSINDDEYNEFSENIIPLQKRVCDGYFLNRALDEVEQILENN